MLQKALLFVMVPLAFSSVSHAAISQTLEQRAVVFLDQGKAQQAYLLLKDQSKRTAQSWFLYGLAAHKSGHIDQAEKAYRKVLELDISSSRAKLELATVLADKRSWPESKRLLLEVKSTNPPAKVRQNIDRYLSLMNQQESSYAGWRVRATAGIIFDSNVNNGPTVDTVTMFGLPFTLSKDAKARSDLAYSFRMEADHVKQVSSELSWQSSLLFNWTDYLEVNEYDSLQLSASTGPVFQLNPETILSLPVTVDTVAYTDRGDFYSGSVGIAPQIRHELTDRFSIDLAANIRGKHFFDNNDRDGMLYGASATVGIRTCEQGVFRLGARFEREDSGIDTYSNDNWDVNSSIFCQLGTNTAANLYGSYGRANFDAREAAYSSKREDQKTTVGTNIQYAHRPWNSNLLIGLSYTHNNSNLPIYDYEKIRGSLSIRKAF